MHCQPRKAIGNAEHFSAWHHSAGRACADAESTGLRFVFRRILTLFQPEFKKSRFAFRLRNALQSERTRQAIFIKRTLLRVGFLKGFGLEGFPMGIGYSSM